MNMSQHVHVEVLGLASGHLNAIWKQETAGAQEGLPSPFTTCESACIGPGATHNRQGPRPLLGISYDKQMDLKDRTALLWQFAHSEAAKCEEV